MPAPSTLLTNAEAVDLAHALVQYVARQNSIRVLSIKGPVSNHYGLRPPRTSADADLLVEPGRFDDLVARLGELGWRERYVSTTPKLVIPVHATTLVHEHWSSDLDLHWYFPGVLHDASAAFDVLWAAHDYLTIAGAMANVPSRLDSIVVSALHASRHASARDETEFDFLADLVSQFDEDQRHSLLARSRALRSVDPLRQFFERAEIPLTDNADSPAAGFDEWTGFVEALNVRGVGWVAELNAARISAKPGILLRAVFVSDAQMRASGRFVGTTRLDLLRARVRRLVDFAVLYPTAKRTADRIASRDVDRSQSG